MKNSKIAKKLLPLLVLPFASSTMAATESFNVGFTTLPEITVTEIQAMAFGSVLKLSAASACTLTANGTNTVTPAESKSIEAQAGTPGLLADDCAGGAAGTVGIYEITALQGSDVNITVTGETNANIQFEPIGYAMDFDGTTGADAVTVVSEAGGTVPITAPATAEFNATVSPGVLRLIMGGTITNQTTLLADTAVTANVTVDVVY
jgi:hypothetical protein